MTNIKIQLNMSAKEIQSKEVEKFVYPRDYKVMISGNTFTFQTNFSLESFRIFFVERFKL